MTTTAPRFSSTPLALAWALPALLLAACAPVPKHRPVDARVVKKLDAGAISRAEFQARLGAPALHRSLLPPAGPIALPMRLTSGTPWVRCGVNGHADVPLMVDTGAGRMLIHARTAAEHGMTMVRPGEMQVQMHGVVGSEPGRVGLISPLEIGDWRIEGYPCFVRMHETTFGRRHFPTNILGFDLPSRFCSYLTLDYISGQVVFGFSRPYRPTPGSGVLKTTFRISQNVPFITLSSRGHTWEALVDTGSFNGIEISQAIAEKLGVQDQGKPVKGMYLLSVGGTVSATDVGLRAVTLPAITLFGETFPLPEVDISPGIPRIGSHFLKDYRVTFDFPRKTLWLERPKKS